MSFLKSALRFVANEVAGNMDHMSHDRRLTADQRADLNSKADAWRSLGDAFREDDD